MDTIRFPEGLPPTLLGWITQQSIGPAKEAYTHALSERGPIAAAAEAGAIARQVIDDLLLQRTLAGTLGVPDAELPAWVERRQDLCGRQN